MAKEQGLKGYSGLKKFDLQCLLKKKNQVSIETQTDFEKCLECYTSILRYRAKLQLKRRVAYDGDLEIDVDSGEVIGCSVDYSKS